MRENTKPSANDRRLSEARVGETFRVVGVEAGHGLRARLLALGITPGVTVQVVQRHGGGPCIIQVRGTRVALGCGILSHIRVRPAT